MERQATKIRLTLSTQAERYARQDAPRDTRLMAARGALPLPAIELATVLFALTHDPDAEVKSTARDSLESLPATITNTVLSGPAHPALLSFFAECRADDAEQLELIALNPATDDATIAKLAASPHKRIVEIISNNQERMVRAPEIVDALGSNLLTGRAAIERILNFIGASEVAADLEGQHDVSTITDQEAEAALRAVLGDEKGIYVQQLLEETDDVTEEQIQELQEGNLFQVVQQMSVFQKIQIGRMGNKEARGLLVRDRNKLVAISVVTSPKITESEIIAIAQSRNVCDEVYRVIATNRDWTRNYQVKQALASNPKCPQAMAMNFVNYLQDKDLRTMMRSRDVPRAISTHARRILMKKGKV
jgi:phage head maturation protease